MRITSKGQVTIPRNVRISLGLQVAQSEIDFIQDENGRWYISKASPTTQTSSRFKTAYQIAQPSMSTEQLLTLTRGDE